MEQPSSVKLTDAATWSLPVRKYTGWVRTAQYVAMADGIKVATYLYLPKGLKDSEKIPTIVIPTPYFSMPKFRSPFFEKLASKLAIAGQGLWAEDFTHFGYATILWDVRGSGASYGLKRCDWVPDMARDTSALIDWIISQPWSNGKVGATGISAPGMICQWMLAAKHPALKAIVPRFTPFDIYNATLIGGLTASRFIQDVGTMLRAMDANQLEKMPKSPPARILLQIFGMQIMPMDEDRGGSKLAEAVRDHVDNEYLDRDLVRVSFNDEQLPSSSTPVTLETLSPYAHTHDMEASGAAIYSYGGWFDGAFPRELSSLFMTVHTPGSKLILGPWGHHAKFNSSPVVEGKQASEFDQAAEIVRFFDFHLKGIDLGISDEMPVHYYTMGEEKWKTASTWPPQNMNSVRYYLAEGNTLSNDVPMAKQACDPYKVDFTAGTGIYSRFGEHLEGGRYPVTYPDRKMRDQKLLTYTSTPLQHDTEITGNPLVTLFISSDTTDGAVFVYLEDVYPDGQVNMVTDGCLRPIFHKISDEKPPYWLAGPYRAYRKADAKPLEIGKTIELTFDLFPVSYLYKTGHSIRLAIAGADADNFVQIPKGESPTLQFYRDGDHPACINLPVFPRS